MFEHAAKLNWEGIVLKRADAPYRSERTEAWQKIKVVQKGKFPVIGFIKDPTGLAALYLGKKEGKDLVYMGKVGTGVVAHCLQPKYASNSIPSSVPNPSSPNPSRSRRRRGWSRHSSQISSTATSRLRDCSELARSRAFRKGTKPPRTELLGGSVFRRTLACARSPLKPPNPQGRGRAP